MRRPLPRQEELSEVKAILEQIPNFLAGDPEATIYHVSSSKPWG